MYVTLKRAFDTFWKIYEFFGAFQSWFTTVSRLAFDTRCLIKDPNWSKHLLRVSFSVSRVKINRKLNLCGFRFELQYAMGTDENDHVMNVNNCARFLNNRKKSELHKTHHGRCFATRVFESRLVNFSLPHAVLSSPQSSSRFKRFNTRKHHHSEFKLISCVKRSLKLTESWSFNGIECVPWFNAKISRHFIEQQQENQTYAQPGESQEEIFFRGEVWRRKIWFQSIKQN